MHSPSLARRLSWFPLLAIAALPALADTFRVATYNLENYLDQPTETRREAKSEAAKKQVRANILALSANYFLSKRTDLYFGAGWQRASGTSSLGTPAVADIDNLGDSSNNHQFIVRAAIRHKF